MSTAYFMLKMLKKKRSIRMRNRTQEAQPTIFSENSKTLVTKCRICLNEGFIFIFETGLPFDLSDAIRTIGGVEVQQNDDYPKHLCEDCHSLLNSAVLFRKSAHETDEHLRRPSTSIAEIHAYEDDALSNCFENDDEPIISSHSCKTCKLEFSTLVEYMVHKNTKKHKNVRIQCHLCHRLLTPQLFKKHLARHESSTHLVCDVCGKLYRKDNLLRHLQLHSNELPFQCQMCPYRGRYMESLKIHLRTHSGDRPFTCDKCELRFITRSNLNRHLLTHKKEKPFKCIECSRGFYTQRDMNAHARADHAGIKDFSCGICGNKYGTKKALMRHELRVHKRDKLAKGRVPLYLQL